MPRNAFHTIPAFLTGFDASAWALTAVLNRGGANTSLTSTRLFEDAVDFLNGRGSDGSAALYTGWRDASSEMSTAWAVAGGPGVAPAITIDLDPTTDHVRITSSTGDFEISADPDLVYWGFDIAGHGAVGGIAPFERVAPNDWTRGKWQNWPLTINPIGLGNCKIPRPDGQWAQSLPVYLRRRGTIADADDQAELTCLEYLDSATNAAATESIRWGIDDDGYVYTSYTAGCGDVTWVDTDFRDRLGFKGTETVTIWGGGAWRTLTARYPCPGVIVPTRPLERIDPYADEVSAAVRLTSGDFASSYAGSYQGWASEFWLDGPADSTDLHEHWLRRVLLYMTAGRRCALYQDWGETRRSGRPFLGLDGATAYDLLQTSELEGYRGRIRGRVAATGGSTHRVQWPGRLRRRAPVSLMLDEAP